MGEVHQIGPGTLWALPDHDRFRFIAVTDTRLVSIFTAALVGPETHDESGSFPVL